MNVIKDVIEEDLNLRDDLINLIRKAVHDIDYKIHDVAKYLYIQEYIDMDKTDDKNKEYKIFCEVMDTLKEEMRHICLSDL